MFCAGLEVLTAEPHAAGERPAKAESPSPDERSRLRDERSRLRSVSVLSYRSQRRDARSRVRRRRVMAPGSSCGRLLVRKTLRAQRPQIEK